MVGDECTSVRMTLFMCTEVHMQLFMCADVRMHKCMVAASRQQSVCARCSALPSLGRVVLPIETIASDGVASCRPAASDAD